MKRFFPLFVSLSLLLCPLRHAAQESAITKPPILSLFDYLHVSRQTVAKVAPHFPWQSGNAVTDYQSTLIRWLEQYPKEWKSLSNMEVFVTNGVSWVTYGIPEKYLPQPGMVNSSWYQWYQASGITNERKQQLFPHFPDLNYALKGDTLGLNFERRVAIWEKLYPQEYIAFLNAPELKSLNPFAQGEITIQYMPRFLGVEISETAPQLENTGDELNDQYQYDLKYRNWLFVFMPDKFKELYGRDFRFPEGFDAEQYRKDMRRMIDRKKDPDWGTGRQGK